MGDIHLLGSNLHVLWLCSTYTVRFQSSVLFIQLSKHRRDVQGGGTEPEFHGAGALKPNYPYTDPIVKTPSDARGGGTEHEFYGAGALNPNYPYIQTQLSKHRRDSIQTQCPRDTYNSGSVTPPNYRQWVPPTCLVYDDHLKIWWLSWFSVYHITIVWGLSDLCWI